MPDSTTGDIIWTRKDPKTWELTNRPSTDEPPVGPGPAGEGGGGAGGPTTLGAADLDVFTNALRANDDRHASAEERHTKSFWRKQLRQFHKSLKTDPDTDAAGGMQELFDTGAAYLKDGDLYTNVPMPSGHKEAMLDAVRQWQDKTGEDNSPGQTQGLDLQKLAQMMGMMGGAQ